MMSLAGRFHATVRSSNRRIVPLRDRAQEDSGQRFGGEVELPGNTRNIVGWDVGAHHSREVQTRRILCLSLKSFNCWSFIGPSLAPKSTVPSVTCWIPPPDPID